MPLAMHCKVIGLYFTMALSERSGDLIVGGTRFKEGKEEQGKGGSEGGKDGWKEGQREGGREQKP